MNSNNNNNNNKRNPGTGSLAHMRDRIEEFGTSFLDDLHCKNRTSAAEKLMKSDKIRPKRKDLVKKLSKILILEYYFEERMHILQCVKYILSYWQDPQHAFREEFAEIIENLQDKDVLITKITEQYKSCCTSHIEASQTHSSPLERNRNCRLAVQYLREQVLLLEIMFLYYRDYLHTSNSLLQTAKLFQSQGFGTKQVNRHLLDARSELLIPQISYLQVLILIESFYLEGVRNLMDDGDFKKHHLVQEPGGIKSLDRLFVSWGSLPQHGPVMLAWAVFRYITMETDQEQDIRRIGSKALQCRVFEFFEGLLKTEVFSGMTPIANSCKSVVYGLLFLVLTMFQEESLGDTQGLDTGTGLLLKSACNSFPLQFLPFLELMKSLAGEEESAGKVFDFLDHMPSYTELLRENSVGDVDCTGDDQVWKIIHPKRLYRGVPLKVTYQALSVESNYIFLVLHATQLMSMYLALQILMVNKTVKILVLSTVQSSAEHLVIPSSTLGVVLPTVQGSAVIQWNYSYSCWDLFVFEMDAFLQSVSLGSGSDGQNVMAIVNLTNEILKNDWSKSEHLVPVTSRLYVIIQRCALSPNLPQNLIASCLTCLATIASHQPLQVWFSLQQTGFLPYCTTARSLDDNKLTIESMNIASGNLGVILSTREQPTGYFPVTMATLRLFLQLLCGIGQDHKQTQQPVNFLDLAACLVFVLREVFTGFYKWRFTAMKYREEIGQRSLEIFNAVLGLQLKQQQQQLHDDMDVDVTEARQQIRSNGSYAQAVVQLIKLAFSVLNKLLERKYKDEEISPLEQALSTQVIHQFKDSTNVYSSSPSQSHLITVIASYIHHRADCRLPTLATLLLKRLCMVAPMSMYASFGYEAVALRDVFVSRLRSLTEDTNLKIATLEFIATAVETQPGLIELFLDLKEKEKNSQVFTLGDHSCLHAVLSMVHPTKQLPSPPSTIIIIIIIIIIVIIMIITIITTATITTVTTITTIHHHHHHHHHHHTTNIIIIIVIIMIITIITTATITITTIHHHHHHHHHCHHINTTQLPSDLVSSAFMLFHALWFDRRDAALTAIRRSEGFWQFLMQPLFADLDTGEDKMIISSHLQTCSYAFQILALETYYVASGQLDDSLKTSLKSFASKQRYQYWSMWMKSACGQDVEDSSTSRPASPLYFTSNENEYLRLLRSWRSFLVVASTVETDAYGLRDSKVRVEILTDTLEALKIKVAHPVSLDVLAAAHELSSLYLMLLKQWKSSLKTPGSTFNTLVDVLESANSNDVQLLDHIRIPVLSCISILLQHSRAENLSGKFDSGYAMALLPLACEPLEYLNGRLGKEDKQQDKVLELSVFVIDEILNILLSNPGQWLPVLREHALFASLVQALDICVKTKEKLEFTEAVLHLFLSLSRIPVSAEALALNNLSQTLCLGVASLFNSGADNQSDGTHQTKPTPIQAIDTNGVVISPSKDWTNVWCLSLAVMASMLRTLRHGFLKEVFDFAGVHRERLARSMDMVRSSQSPNALQEAEGVTAFLFELGHFSKEWRFNLLDVLELLQVRIGVLCQSCIAMLTHPRLLAHLLEMSTGNPLQKGSQPLSELSQCLSSSFSAHELLRTYSYADEDSFRNNPVVSNTQTKLLKILCKSLAMLRQFTPDICEILLDEGMDIDEYVPIATLGFSSPAIDREEPLSFGTLLACLNMCLTNLSPGGDVRSPVKSPVKTLSETLPRSLLMFAMENAMVLVLSQASRYLRDPGVDPRVKQLLKRELGSELGHFLGGLNRHFVRRGLPPSPLSERTSPSPSSKKTPTKAPAFSEAPEQKFFKLADLYVKKLLR
ncbi:hypothetical protein QZH41_020284 [Actinostola sp. cb2023]|nr:hypothetical protein QZH41_020284 [Actinostola sp. cb2023]